MSYYRIKAILHSGRKGERNTPRTDGRYPLRINRIIKFDDESDSLFVGCIMKGAPLILDYVKDENGNDYSGFYLQTSTVIDWDFIYENVIRVETNNSIYEFERVKGE